MHSFSVVKIRERGEKKCGDIERGERKKCNVIEKKKKVFIENNIICIFFKR